MEREWFRDLDRGVIYVRRLKRLPRIPWLCAECGKRVKVSHTKIGKEHECPRCGFKKDVVHRGTKIDTNPPETIPPIVEDQVQDYIRSYLKKMRPDQRWLIEGFKGKQISTRCIRIVWDTYAGRAGISAKTSFHALRHGRGAQLWDEFKDQKLVQDMLGHANISASAFYIHNNPKIIESRKRQLERKFERTRNGKAT
jgi:integrase